MSDIKGVDDSLFDADLCRSRFSGKRAECVAAREGGDAGNGQEQEYLFHTFHVHTIPQLANLIKIITNFE